MPFSAEKEAFAFCLLTVLLLKWIIFALYAVSWTVAPFRSQFTKSARRKNHKKWLLTLVSNAISFIVGLSKQKHG